MSNIESSLLLKLSLLLLIVHDSSEKCKDPTWLKTEKFCYRLMIEKRTFDDAKQGCISHNSTLILPENIMEMGKIMQSIPTLAEVWVDMYGTHFLEKFLFSRLPTGVSRIKASSNGQIAKFQKDSLPLMRLTQLSKNLIICRAESSKSECNILAADSQSLIQYSNKAST
ncbi:hypothetical protein T07_1993 [Trichinella nelsoni]|uniref:C-type lectin domain-containing protein n=1 Tax=Trichinella nelsoni TaxID=6336 RepID=A0A0V0SK47_9BILA|nr:hypothetical protein T07_1993 [Trichinella nelsoni]